MEYINKTYQTNFSYGSRILYTGGKEPVQGTVIGAQNAHLKIELDNGHVGFYHPTWELVEIES